MINTTSRSPRPERNNPSLQDHRGGSIFLDVLNVFLFFLQIMPDLLSHPWNCE
jgi:hypothetical protein